MDERRDEYGFCPKCGAIMQNGVCQSCGYGRKLGMQPSGPDGPYDGTPKKRKMSAGSKVVISLIVILVLLLAVFIGLAVRAVIGQKDKSSSLHIDDDFFGGWYSDPDDSEDGYDDWYDDYDWDDESDGYEVYEPSPDDPYYTEIVDATVQDLSYEIEWHGISIYPDDDDCSEYYSATIPYIISDDKELMDWVNEEIREMVCKYQDSYREYAFGSYSIGYVTYMSEDRLSVVVRHDLEGSDYRSLFELDALTFDMGTGQVIPYEDMVQADMELVKRFRSQNSLQNGTVPFLDQLTDEELLEYLQDDETRMVFLTPVGTELGFNYSGGWVTVTLKDQAL